MSAKEFSVLLLFFILIFGGLGALLVEHTNKRTQTSKQAEKAKIEEARQQGILQGRAQVYKEVFEQIGRQKGLSFGGQATY